MYCAKCGKFVADGQVCPCEGKSTVLVGQLYGGSEVVNPVGASTGYYGYVGNKDGKAVAKVLKLVGAVLVVLAFFFHFFDMISLAKDFSISEREIEIYEEDVEDAVKDFADGKISVSEGFYTNQEGSNPLQTNGSGYAGVIRSLAIFFILAFGLYAGALVASFGNKKADTLRLVAQGLFFMLLLVSLIMFALYVSTMGNMYGADGEDIFVMDYSLAFGWWLTAIFTVTGLVITVLSSLLGKNKE